MDDHNKNQLLICNECMMTAKLDENSTGYCESCGSANVKRKDIKDVLLVAGGDDMTAVKEAASRAGISEDNIILVANADKLLKPEEKEVIALIEAGQMVRENFEMPLMPKQSQTPYHKDIMKKGRNQFKKGGRK